MEPFYRVNCALLKLVRVHIEVHEIGPIVDNVPGVESSRSSGFERYGTVCGPGSIRTRFEHALARLVRWTSITDRSRVSNVPFRNWTAQFK